MHDDIAVSSGAPSAGGDPADGAGNAIVQLQVHGTLSTDVPRSRLELASSCDRHELFWRLLQIQPGSKGFGGGNAGGLAHERRASVYSGCNQSGTHS